MKNKNIYKIKSKKQDNGLWGIPVNVVSIDSIPNESESILFSAILMAFGECYPNSSISVKKTMSIGLYKITINNNKIELKDENHWVSMFYYGLIGDTLFFIRDEENKKFYERLLKIKILKQKSTSPL